MSGRRGFILNATYAAAGAGEGGDAGDPGRAVVQLYGKLDDGRPFLIRDRRHGAYFYLESDAVERARAAGRGATLGATLTATGRVTFDGRPVHRVGLARPQDAAPLRTRLHRAGIATYEADVRFAYRYLIDRGIRGALRIHGDPRPPEDRERTAGGGAAAVEPVVFDEPELEPAEWTPRLTILSFDLETDPEPERLLSIGLWGCGAREVLLWCPDAAARAACPPHAVPCADEAELLTTFAARVRALDPDVLTGWSIIDYDVPVLLRRAAAAGVRLELGRFAGALRQRSGGSAREGGRRFSDSVFIPGRVVLDGIRLLRAVAYRLPSYGLDSAARAILGEGKRSLPAATGAGGDGEDDRADDPVTRIRRAFRRQPARFVDYNLTDARLAFDILEKLQLVPFTVERSKLTGMPPDRVGASIAAFDYLYLSCLHARGVVAPTVGAPAAPAAAAAGSHNQGGHVLEPCPGLHDQVLVFDFKSLYPSIMRTFRIDPLGLVRDSAPAAAAIEAPNGARFRRGSAILSELLDDLFASRERAKRAGNRVASNAIKILMNSFYGVLGTPSCRFADPRLANAITGFGKHFLLWAKAWMEARGRRVLYGDTDSLFVAARDRARTGSAERLAEALNRDLAAYVRATWDLPSHLEMEFERRFERLFLPLVRGGGRGATKRYVGLAQGGLHFTGMEVVRRDWTALAREVQRELYRRWFAGEPVEEYLRQVIGEVTAGRRDAQLVYHKALRKEVGDYQAAAPHVVAARKRTGPAPPGAPREVIDYVITVTGPEPAERTGRPPRLDYEHYVERQIRPVAEPVLATLGRDFGEVRRNERQLELF